ncbi:hypothetical protein ACFSQD_14465 [Flavihumibacter stibioxidans]|uniref:Uncharacterized protein n=1 Tax=Flavihumibacter stibioxidans TaxID=1834163 RepID=A0ABR7M830_9BACT|nr:hypothetical protein [Flavihumibacter stibioxidans]MBC6491193.1 hypothetical protein [Flavihumibacter stibioxidans]
MKSFLIIAVPLVLLSAAAAAAILQPLRPEASPPVTMINGKKSGQELSSIVFQAALKSSRKTVKKSGGCCLRCI